MVIFEINWVKLICFFNFFLVVVQILYAIWENHNNKVEERSR